MCRTNFKRDLIFSFLCYSIEVGDVYTCTSFGLREDKFLGRYRLNVSTCFVMSEPTIICDCRLTNSKHKVTGWFCKSIILNSQVHTIFWVCTLRSPSECVFFFRVRDWKIKRDSNQVSKRRRLVHPSIGFWGADILNGIGVRVHYWPRFWKIVVSFWEHWSLFFLSASFSCIFLGFQVFFWSNGQVYQMPYIRFSPWYQDSIRRYSNIVLLYGRVSSRSNVLFSDFCFVIRIGHV